MVEVTPQQEVDLILHYISEKVGYEFQLNVRLSGYANAPLYALEASPSTNEFLSSDRYVIMIGKEVANVLDIYQGFLERFWERRAEDLKVQNGEGEYFINEVSRELENIATSRNELLLKAQIAGLI